MITGSNCMFVSSFTGCLCKSLSFCPPYLPSQTSFLAISISIINKPSRTDLTFFLVWCPRFDDFNEISFPRGGMEHFFLEEDFHFYNFLRGFLFIVVLYWKAWRSMLELLGRVFCAATQGVYAQNLGRWAESLSLYYCRRRLWYNIILMRIDLYVLGWHFHFRLEIWSSGDKLIWLPLTL